MTAGWCARTLRAAVFAAVCVLLAAIGHIMMSGSSVAWWALAVGATATGGVGWGLADRERGPSLIVPVVLAVQTALHSAFSLAQSGAQPTASGTASGTMDAMDMTSMGHDMGSMDMGRMGHMGHLGHAAGGTPSFGMLCAHLVAALVCGLWLAQGERAAFRILRAVAGRLVVPLRLLLALPAPAVRPRIRVRRRSQRAPRRHPFVHAITSRGPPVGTAVV